MRRAPIRTIDEIGYDAIVTFWRRVDRKQDRDSCWLWRGLKNPKGYGRCRVGERHEVQAHRVGYILERGEIPEGKTLDHICRERGCVNPWHLEPVTNQENIRRGEWVQRSLRHKAALAIGRACGYRVPRAQGRSRKPRTPLTHCKRGHELVGDNVKVQRVKGQPSRVCRQCCALRDKLRDRRGRVLTEAQRVRKNELRARLRRAQKNPSVFKVLPQVESHAGSRRAAF